MPEFRISDGSAFVTKEELNKLISQLEARVSQLESSLDARIDNVISSYLSKNPIK